MLKIKLRNYQKECIKSIPESGSHLIVMATGLGKTATFTHIPRKGRVLILAHREELVRQPIKYFDCKVGIEMAKEYSKGDEEVVIASVPSLIRRLSRFKPDDFDMIITDEAHHAAAKSYKKIYSYFKPRLHIGFTATPNRGDNVRLDDVFEDIIFERNLKWGIQNNYLSNIYCLRADIGYDISKVARRLGDYAVNELENKLNIESINDAIAEAYHKYAKGQTLIFATTVAHAKAIAKKIPGAVAITNETKNRDKLIKKFTEKKIPVIVNCMVFTEGTDMPLVETIMIARPTTNSSLYTQMVGRGLRLYPGKEKLTLIDLVGVTGKANLCTAPSLLGLDMDNVPKMKRNEIQGDLFELEDLINEKADCIESWINNVEVVNLWAKNQDYNLRKINFFKLSNGNLAVSLGKKGTLTIPAPNEVGKTTYNGEVVDMQTAIDMVYNKLIHDYQNEQRIWDMNCVNKWGKDPATKKQITTIKKLAGEKVTDKFLNNLTKFEASNILSRLFCE